MDAKPSQLASQPLKYQTWFLKVSIHCEGCRRKVKKVLKSIDGVFTATIDQQQQKVTVTGSVGVDILLRKLVRAGKHAEIWPENNLNGKELKKKQKKNEARKSHSLENNGTENSTTAKKCNNQNNSPEKSLSGDQIPAEGGGGGGCMKKKKKVQIESGGGNGNSSSLSSAAASTGAPAHTGLQFEDVVVGQVNVSPPRQQPFSYPETGYPPNPMVYVAAAYNRFYPSYNYYVPSSPYICAALDQDAYYNFQSAPLISFEIFSDENANGCSVM